MHGRDQRDMHGKSIRSELLAFLDAMPANDRTDSVACQTWIREFRTLIESKLSDGHTTASASVLKTLHAVEIWARDVDGITHYLDRFGNIYDANDVIEKHVQPRVVGKIDLSSIPIPALDGLPVPATTVQVAVSTKRPRL